MDFPARFFKPTIHSLNNLKIRWKLLIAILPLVLIPLLSVGLIVGYVAKNQAHLGITQASRVDLEHMADFTLDLLNAHYQQFQVYKEDKRQTINRDLATIVKFAYNVLAVQHDQYSSGRSNLVDAQQEARRSIKAVNVGATGYLYAMTTTGDLTIHVAQEGQNIIDAQDNSGRYFIREMLENAKITPPGEVSYIIYPWRNELLGDPHPREKIVAYTYFQPWNWIIAAGSYLDETYHDLAFEKQAFNALKTSLLSKKVGETGYIYAMSRQGQLTIHPFREGQVIYDEQDQQGNYFIREMIERKTGWIRYPWQNETDLFARMKIVRYQHFEPWDWIVAVGSYEDEFYKPAAAIEGQILWSVGLLTLLVGFGAGALVIFTSKILTAPLQRLTEAVREVKCGKLDTHIAVTTNDELGELAENFNLLTAVLRQNKILEDTLAQQGKMASLGVLSSGVAHEINNPLGVILGYAAYLESKMDSNDPHYTYIQEIKRESKRCKTIVQDLLSYARVPRPVLEETSLNGLIDQIIDFAAHHTDMGNVTIIKNLDPLLPPVPLDGDQIRQVAINIILNAGAAMPKGGLLTVSTTCIADEAVEIRFTDTGCGIAPEHLEKVFEPFFTTKTHGTGLGLAITKTIIEQHHGTIDIQSVVNQGTTVAIRLPLTQTARYQTVA